MANMTVFRQPSMDLSFAAPSKSTQIAESAFDWNCSTAVIYSNVEMLQLVMNQFISKKYPVDNLQGINNKKPIMNYQG